MLRSLASLGVVLLVMVPVAGEGLLFQLPADGTSATFDLEMKGTIPPDKKLEGKGVLTMASVGKENRDGEPCRWIELAMKFHQTEPEAQQVHVVTKVLVPEKHAKAGAAPSDHVVEAWRKSTSTNLGTGKTSEEKVRALNLKRPRGPGDVFPLFGPYKDAKKLAKQEVESGLGKLDCEGLTGTWTFKREDGVSTHTTVIHFENRLHPKAPFGVVTLTMKQQDERDGKPTGSVTMTMRLSKVSTGAKSELAEPGEK